jgi:hypothetical protein
VIQLIAEKVAIGSLSKAKTARGYHLMHQRHFLPDVENLSWKDFTREAFENPAYSDSTKAEISSSFRILEKHLGDDLLKLDNLRGHFLAFKLVNYAEWTRQWIIWFAECLENLKAAENFEKVITFFRYKSNSTEKYQILRTAYKFYKAGFDIIFEPEIETEKGRRSPDLLLQSPSVRDGIFVEISAVTHSAERRSMDEFVRKILGIITPEINSQYCGILYSPCQDDEIAILQKEITDAYATVRKYAQLIEIYKPDKYRIFIANKENADFAAIATELGLQSNGLGIVTGKIDEVKRLKSRIGQKMNKLRKDSTNILVLYSDSLSISEKSSQEIIDVLHQKVELYPHLFACGFLSESMMFNRLDEASDTHRGKFFSSSLDGTMYESGYLAINPKFSKFIQPTVSNRIIRAF